MCTIQSEPLEFLCQCESAISSTLLLLCCCVMDGWLRGNLPSSWSSFFEQSRGRIDSPCSSGFAKCLRWWCFCTLIDYAARLSNSGCRQWCIGETSKPEHKTLLRMHKEWSNNNELERLCSFSLARWTRRYQWVWANIRCQQCLGKSCLNASNHQSWVKLRLWSWCRMIQILFGFLVRVETMNLLSHVSTSSSIADLDCSISTWTSTSSFAFIFDIALIGLLSHPFCRTFC